MRLIPLSLVRPGMVLDYEGERVEVATVERYWPAATAEDRRWWVDAWLTDGTVVYGPATDRVEWVSPRQIAGEVGPGPHPRYSIRVN